MWYFSKMSNTVLLGLTLNGNWIKREHFHPAQNSAPLPETLVLMSDETAVMNGFQPHSAIVLFSWTTSSVVRLDPSWQSQ